MLELDSARNRRLGIAMVCVTTLCFSALDTTAKWLVLSLPVFQVVWLRFLTHSLLGLALLAPRYGMRLVRVQQPKLQALRALMLAVLTGLNFWALRYLQLDVTAAIQFSVPIMIALISARWLGERLDARSWIAIVLGFGGVLLIVRPGSQAFHPAIVLSILNAVLYAAFNLLTRRLAATELPAATQLLSAIGATVLLTPLGLLQWKTPEDWLSWMLVLSMGLVGGLGHLMVAQAHRYASAAVLAPFLYQQIVYMGLLGWLVFGHVPDLAVVSGAAIVTFSGLYLLYREFRR
ncbi:MAG: DMT family transporter [Betaproteobacteria bacterium]|jgi:drug/metabolite transporter (DMT)-like permease|nr:DMT family transporter [Betaproteobacteria bacterium]